MDLTKPSLTRLARRAGVKSLSEDCYPIIRTLIQKKTDEIVKAALVLKSQHGTKTLMTDDVYKGLEMLGENVAQSDELGLRGK